MALILSMVTEVMIPYMLIPMDPLIRHLLTFSMVVRVMILFTEMLETTHWMVVLEQIRSQVVVVPI